MHARHKYSQCSLKDSKIGEYMWSILVYTSRVTDGAIIVLHFEAKAKVDEFIKQVTNLLANTIFVYFTTFAINLVHYVICKPVVKHKV